MRYSAISTIQPELAAVSAVAHFRDRPPGQVPEVILARRDEMHGRAGRPIASPQMGNPLSSRRVARTISGQPSLRVPGAVRWWSRLNTNRLVRAPSTRVWRRLGRFAVTMSASSCCCPNSRRRSPASFCNCVAEPKAARAGTFWNGQPAVFRHSADLTNGTDAGPFFAAHSVLRINGRTPMAGRTS